MPNPDGTAEKYDGEEKRDKPDKTAEVGKFIEGAPMMGAVRQGFDRIIEDEGVRTPEAQRLLDQLMSQRETAASVWTETYPIEGVPAKDYIVADAERFLQSLPPEVLQGFAELCPQSELVVVPGGVTAKELAKITDKVTIYDPELWNDVKSSEWKFAIAGIGDDGDMPFEESVFYLNSDAPKEDRKP
ncbi:MAG: hypothetical protein WC269_01845, partial [Candidatus Gracilibacteria bacterium]